MILISLDGETAGIIEFVQRIRDCFRLSENAPAIIFYHDEYAKNEVAVAPDIFFSCPENFNQLRSCIRCLLQQFERATKN